MFCLDTNIIIGVMTRRLPKAVDRLAIELAAESAFFVSVIVHYELAFGALKSAFPGSNIERLAIFLTQFPAATPFDVADAQEAGEIRADLERRGQPIGPCDVLIAAQVRRRGATLITNNVREFARVPGLDITDWGA